MRNSNVLRLTLAAALSMSGCSAIANTIAPRPQKPCPKSEWAIGIIGGTDVFKQRDLGQIENPVMRAAHVTDRNARFVADPFMLPHNGRWFLFFEVLNRGTEQGDIGYAESADLKHWEYRQIVLDEPFHLSYPYVFEDHGEIYMIPETRQAGAIRLYKADPFPTGWKFEKELVRGSFADSSIFRHDGRWWIFSVQGPYNFVIYSADSLHGDWIEHPKNPIYESDGTKARAGGRVIPYQGKLLRFAQDSRGGYGKRLRVFIVDELSQTAYREHEAVASPILSPTGDGWKSQAMHTMDAWHLTDGNWVSAIDGAGCPAPPPASLPQDQPAATN